MFLRSPEIEVRVAEGMDLAEAARSLTGGDSPRGVLARVMQQQDRDVELPVWGDRVTVPFSRTLWGTGNGLTRSLPAPRWGSARTIRHLGPSRSSRVRCTGTGSAPIGAFLCSSRGLRQREICSWLDAPIDQERRRRIFCG